MTTGKLDRATVYRRIKHAIRLTQEARYEDALPLFEMYLPLLDGQGVDERRLLTRASSYYGVCVAFVKRRFTEALDSCNVSLAGEVAEPEHHANVALVHLWRRDRRAAVKHLTIGAELQHDHPRINLIFYKIGRRGRPPVPFLGRDHWLNVWLGRRRGIRRTARLDSWRELPEK